MQTQTASTVRTAKLRYPDYPAADHPAFWLYVWMAERAQLAALSAWLSSPTTRLPKDPALRGALWASHAQLQEKLRETIKNVRDDGLLLCAWDATTMVPA